MAGTTNRRDQVLDAALAVFGRYGFRKTSMDEVARAAAISRPGLYLHFSSKEELFRETMRRELDGALDEVRALLADADRDLPERIARALDAGIGRYVGTTLAVEIGALIEGSAARLGSMFAEYGASFDALITEALAGLPLGGIGPDQAAQTLHATAKGWKQQVSSRAEFLERMTVAVGLFCGAHARP